MELDPDLCYRLLSARDRRFDGLFFVGVSTTGIYCRPICPARLPGRERCSFHASAAAAERVGFRPCLRCRPELAPGVGPLEASAKTAEDAYRLIQAGALNEGSVQDLADQLGVSSRQLRRTVQASFGAGPVELAQTQRLLQARRLLLETQLPITEVAWAAGFSSIRRFNALFQHRYRSSPAEIRRKAGGQASGEALTLRLDTRPPFDWEALMGWFTPRFIPGVETQIGGAYARTVRMGGHTGWIILGPSPHPERPQLELRVSPSLTLVLPKILARVRGLADLDARPDVIAAHLQSDPLLATRLAARPGLRVPGAFDGFEMAVRAILGQQISVRGAMTLAGRLAERFGDPVVTSHPELQRLSPTPEQLAALGEEEIRSIGLTRSRAHTLRRLSEAVADGRIRLEPGSDPDLTMRQLQELPGIGDWTAQYIALRALRWPDAFPAGDLILRRRLGGLSEREVRERAEPWRPWRAYAALYLWTEEPTP